MTDKEQKKWHEQKWGTNEEPEETPTERPHCDDDSIKNQDKEQIIIDGLNVLDTIDEWVNTVVNDRCTAEEAEIEYSNAEVIQNYILDINKQLARKTQECEELRVTYNKAQDILGRIDKANELKSLTVQKLAKQCEELQKQLEFVRTHRTVIDAEKDRYRKALEEIEKVAKIHNDIPDLPCGVEDCKYPKCYDDLTNHGKTCMRSGLIEIIDIINKAKGERG